MLSDCWSVDDCDPPPDGEEQDDASDIDAIDSKEDSASAIWLEAIDSTDTAIAVIRDATTKFEIILVPAVSTAVSTRQGLVPCTSNRRGETMYCKLQTLMYIYLEGYMENITTVAI